jgi:hypothetical protein
LILGPPTFRSQIFSDAFGHRGGVLLWLFESREPEIGQEKFILADKNILRLDIMMTAFESKTQGP